jgi:hypothetical protein
VGDLHQPLHTVSRITPELPKGDRGGNDVHFSAQLSLHHFWDDGGGLFVEIPRPLTPEGEKKLNDLATQIERQNPEDAQARNLDLQEWLWEGRTMAFQYAYADVVPGQMPTAAYTQRTKQVCAGRVALAGYRLANLLNDLVTR